MRLMPRGLGSTGCDNRKGKGNAPEKTGKFFNARTPSPGCLRDGPGMAGSNLFFNGAVMGKDGIVCWKGQLFNIQV